MLIEIQEQARGQDVLILKLAGYFYAFQLRNPDTTVSPVANSQQVS